MRALLGVVVTFLVAVAAAVAVAPAAVAGPPTVVAAGTFDVAVDFSTLSTLDVGDRCLLRVEGTLDFSGTLTGTATGTTTALVDATCAQVMGAGPGTYGDVFVSRLTYTDGDRRARLVYAGTTEPGGAIAGGMVFAGQVRGVLDVTATLGVGGTYTGVLVTG